MRSLLNGGINGVKNGFKLIDFSFREFNKAKEQFLVFLSKNYIPRVFTPNRLSWFRICLALIISLMLFQYSQWKVWILILFIISGITDVFDGPIARAWKLESKEGVFLDRLADKLLICPLVARIIWQYDRFLVLILIGAELFSISLAVSAMRKGISNQVTKSNLFGKWKMVFQWLGIVTLLFFPERINLATDALWFALGLGLASVFGHFQSYISSRGKNGIE